MEEKNKKVVVPPQKHEKSALVLDYLSRGYLHNDMSKFKGKAIAQVIGTDYFTLLELTPNNGSDYEIGETVSIEKGKTFKDGESKPMGRVLGKLDYNLLTATSRIEIDYAIRELVEAQEDKFVEFFNTAGPLSTRFHKLELIPGIGKKHMWTIIEARKEKPFESFKDISERVPAISDPAGMIVNRIKQELAPNTSKRGKNKYYLFTNIPTKKSSRQ